ncbi:alpha/beta hydrolase [Rhodococcus globerulus]|uniref:alpha/beta hydrolase n=1 Tax=Rhodococcus globerulus TaxID=33008 RepID=UPI003019E011
MTAQTDPTRVDVAADVLPTPQDYAARASLDSASDIHPRTRSVPLDPELAAAIGELKEQGLAPYHTFSIDELATFRASTSYRDRAIATIDGAAVTREERLIPGTVGAPNLEISIVRPLVPVPSAPCIYFIHGGGMMMGSRYEGIESYLELIEKDGLVVVSVEYRLAPEHPDPAPVEDCYAGLAWVSEHAEELGIDPDRLLIAGGSAGGGLTAGVTLLARDRQGPHLVGSMLQCPMLDDRNQTVSSAQHEQAVIWDRETNRVGWTALLGERRGGPDVSPYAAPARASDLSGLPPTFLDAGTAEVFRDEAVDYASRIWAAGGDAELHIWPGGFHGYEMVPNAALSRNTRESRERWIRRILSL